MALETFRDGRFDEVGLRPKSCSIFFRLLNDAFVRVFCRQLLRKHFVACLSRHLFAGHLVFAANGHAYFLGMTGDARFVAAVHSN